jgi:hypothetical protein
MKLLPYGIACAFLFLLQTARAQSVIPEMIFQNPVLVSGTAGQNGAIYKFSNVATGIDARVKIVSRSASNVVLTNIDVANMGWTKAFQPQLGIPGNVAPNQEWWMEFEIRFVKTNTNESKRVNKFYITSIDNDGDGVSIREFIQMNKIKTHELCPVSYLTNMNLLNLSSGDDDDDDNNVGYNKRFQGPVQNFYNIDTIGTQVMSTYTYEKKDKITVVIGGRSGTVVSNAGERLNSLWFKDFDLSTPSILPVKLNAFNVQYSSKDANLSWSTAGEVNFSHFVIERSMDGKNFTEAALVFGAGTTSQLMNYTYRDQNITSSTGVVYYRLRMVDISKEASYSETKVVRLAKNNALVLTAFPNPVVDELKITLPSAWQGKKVSFEVYNGAGTRIFSKEEVVAGQTESISFRNFARGAYIIKATSGSENLQERVIKN